MSWSVQKIAGKPDKVKPIAEAAFDASAKSYAGKLEEQDVLGAKAAVMSFLDNAAQPGNLGETEGVEIEANGSRGEGTWAYVNIMVKCTKIAMHT